MPVWNSVEPWVVTIALQAAASFLQFCFNDFHDKFFYKVHTFYLLGTGHPLLHMWRSEDNSGVRSLLLPCGSWSDGDPPQVIGLVASSFTQ